MSEGTNAPLAVHGTPVRFPLEVRFRVCHEDDLPHLEWFGLFTHHRAIIRDAFERQRRGENVMLLAVSNEFPIGQAWADLARLRHESAALVWAVRVLPPLQGLGIGASLIEHMESLLARRGFAEVEVGVEKDNTGARRLYERLGYRVVSDRRAAYAYTTPAGLTEQIAIDEWFLRKRVRPQRDR